MGDARSLTQAAGRLAVRAGLALATAAALANAVSAGSPPPARSDPLDPFAAEYAIEVRGLVVGSMRRTLRPDGDAMVYHSETSATGLAAVFWHQREVENSRWRLAGDGRLLPLSYRYQRDGRRKPKRVAIEFDWSRGQMDVSVNDRRQRDALVPPLHDRLLYELALMRDLARQVPRLRYRVADGGKLKTYELARDGTERVASPLGTFDTVRLVRHKAGSRRRTTVWCAPRLGFLPVRVEHVDGKGTLVRATLRRLAPPALGLAPRSARRSASG